MGVIIPIAAVILSVGACKTIGRNSPPDNPVPKVTTETPKAEEPKAEEPKPEEPKPEEKTPELPPPREPEAHPMPSSPPPAEVSPEIKPAEVPMTPMTSGTPSAAEHPTPPPLPESITPSLAPKSDIFSISTKLDRGNKIDTGIGWIYVLNNQPSNLKVEIFLRKPYNFKDDCMFLVEEVEPKAKVENQRVYWVKALWVPRKDNLCRRTIKVTRESDGKILTHDFDFEVWGVYE